MVNKVRLLKISERKKSCQYYSWTISHGKDLQSNFGRPINHPLLVSRSPFPSSVVVVHVQQLNSISIVFSNFLILLIVVLLLDINLARYSLEEYTASKEKAQNLELALPL